MIRFVVGLFLFAVALCAYIVSLPHEDGRRPAQPIAVVPEAPAEPSVDVTAAGSDDITAADALTAIVVDAGAPANLGFEISREPVVDTISTVLVSLGLEESVRETAPLSSLELLLKQSLRDRIHDEKIVQKVTDDALAGAITIPDVLVTASGGIDTPVLLTAIIARAAVVAGAEATPAQIPASGQTHIVIDGDSVAGLAVRYYGDIAKTDVVLRANTDVLGQAEQIAVGQALVMPAL